MSDGDGVASVAGCDDHAGIAVFTAERDTFAPYGSRRLDRRSRETNRTLRDDAPSRRLDRTSAFRLYVSGGHCTAAINPFRLSWISVGWHWAQEDFRHPVVYDGLHKELEVPEKAQSIYHELPTYAIDVIAQ